MTYCLGISVDDGLVLASDSRTNAGVDQISTYSKMHRFHLEGERTFVLLSSGNLATTQAVTTKLRRDLEEEASTSLFSASHLGAAAEYVGKLSVVQQRKHSRADEQVNLDAWFILGGQIAGKPPDILLIYPEGNYIRASKQTPYLQIGELKYGKPILDRIVSLTTSLDDATLCALVSMDSTMRSNATVGPPVEVLIYEKDTLTAGKHRVFREYDPYLSRLRVAWQRSLNKAFEDLPRMTDDDSLVRLVDEQT
jgi:putative proteasome-type protease